MDLSTIISLWENNALPNTIKALSACRQQVESAYKVTLESWAVTANGSTSKMLYSELRLYAKIIYAIKTKTRTLSGAPQRETSAMKRHRSIAFYSTSAQ